MKRAVLHEPAYVLHRYDFSESSLILECFSRRHGRIAVLAKGAKRPSSNFRPVLLPLQPLSIGFGGESEIRTLKAAEWAGGQVMPTGDALLSGYYINELLMRLLARDDPHPELFDAYAACVRVLASMPPASHPRGEVDEEPEAEDELERQAARGVSQVLHSAALRAFELILLREIGLLPSLGMETPSLHPLEDSAPYSLHAEGGLVRADAGERALTGMLWRQLDDALGDEAPFSATLRVAAAAKAPLRHQLRALLHYHCGVAMLRTRQMVHDVQSL